MYITNQEHIAIIAEESGVDRIFVDLESIGKAERQSGRDTVQSRHSFDDIYKMKKVLKKAELIVRINPLHQSTIFSPYDTKQEIDIAINSGADIIMLPMYRTLDDVSSFTSIINKRIKTCLLLETADAESCIDDVIELSSFDEIHIGLNDLHIEKKKEFMFELLSDGTIENLCNKLRQTTIKYGFGGIARVGYGMLPAELIIAEHYRLGSTMAILSRGFCNATSITDENELYRIFVNGVENIRIRENEITHFTAKDHEDNVNEINKCVNTIVEQLREKSTYDR
jgi:hypothetical protein